ncbi:hypothetical protein FKM82_024968 [Ascaphus truei]
MMLFISKHVVLQWVLVLPPPMQTCFWVGGSQSTCLEIPTHLDTLSLFTRGTAPTHFIRANAQFVPGRYLESAAAHLLHASLRLPSQPRFMPG